MTRGAAIVCALVVLALPVGSGIATVAGVRAESVTHPPARIIDASAPPQTQSP